VSVEVGRPAVSLTDNAVAKLKEMLAEQEDTNLCLRVFIQQGGCDGYSYGMTFDSPEPDDEIIEKGGVRLLVDRASSRFLRGSEIDYVTSVTSTGFAIRNPNAVTTCGCGHSFKTAEDAGRAEPCGEGEEGEA
jgi:iron-sulfur cluster assembly protein